MEKRKLGLIVNPIAGLGGPLGIGGSDGLSWLAEEKVVGPSYKRAITVLRGLKDGLLSIARETLDIIAGEGIFGGLSLLEASIEPDREIKCEAIVRECSRDIAAKMRREGAELILFFGGDGTAYDIAVGAGGEVPIVGFPTGTKMYNRVFVLSERHLQDVMTSWLEGDFELIETDVVLIDEEKLNRGSYEVIDRAKARTPYLRERGIYQESKDFSSVASEEDIEGIAKYLEEIYGFPRRGAWIVGPGSTLQKILSTYRYEKNFLGFMAIIDGHVICHPCSSEDLSRILRRREDSMLLLSPLGGSGFLIGRGNKELTSSVLRALRDIRKIIVVSPRGKISRLRRLLVDTGNRELDRAFEGYMRVIVGYYEESVVKVLSVSSLN